MAFGSLNVGTITPGSGNTLTVSETVTFSGTVSMQSANNQGFASGTKMLFNQTAAPTGWTKVTSSNDVALRVVSGTVGTGGSVAFETAFASQTATASSGSVSGHTLAFSEVPKLAKNPTAKWYYNAGSYSSGAHPTLGFANNSDYTHGGSHTHGFTNPNISAINLDVSYVDVIIATKD